MSRIPTYRVSTQHYLRATGAGLGAAILCGIIWGLLNWVIPFLSFNLLLSPAAGYAISEAISRSVNRKRGRGLAIIAGFAVVIAYLVTLLFPGGIPFGIFGIMYHLVSLGVGVFVSVNRLR